MMCCVQAQWCFLLEFLVTAVMADACDQAWTQRSNVPFATVMQPAYQQMYH